MKKISVVVPCFNAAEYLHYCIDHLLRQTIGLENIEIILVDDASTDGGATWNVIRQYESRYPDNIIAIALEENLRQGGARNVGISYASGDYLVFCDADDWFRVEALELLYRVAIQENADVVGFRYEKVPTYSYEGERLPIKSGNKNFKVMLDDDKTRREQILVSRDEFTLGCMDKFYRLSLIREHEIRFAEHLVCEEPSFVLPVRLYMVNYVFADMVLYYYFRNPTSTTRGSWEGRQLDNAAVWIQLFAYLTEKGLVEKYPLELEYMFWSWGVELTIEMAVSKNIYMGVPEMSFLQKITRQYCPDIRSNPYLAYYNPERTAILIEIADMELTEDNVREINRQMIECLLQGQKK